MSTENHTHTVEQRYSPADVNAFVQRLFEAGLNLKPIEHFGSVWCDANCKGGWSVETTFDNIDVVHRDGRGQAILYDGATHVVTFAFEREEDAVLFKMFNEVA